MAHLQADVKTTPSTTARAAPRSVPGLLKKEMIYLNEKGWASLGVWGKEGDAGAFPA